MNQKIKLGKINCIFFSLLLCSTVYAQKPVTGQVFDPKGEPIVGASVHVKGTEIYSSTDLDGNYYLRNVLLGSDIEVAYIGYSEKKIKYQGQDTINVALGNIERFRWGLTISSGGKTKYIDNVSVRKMVFMGGGGFVFEIPLKNRFFIVPELLFATIQRDYDDYNYDHSVYDRFDQFVYSGKDITLYESHIQVPVNLMKKIKLSNKIDFELFAGLSTSYVFSRGYQYFEENYSAGVNRGGYWDIGTNAGFGFSLSHFFIKMQYHRILTTQVNYDIRNLIYFSYGYLF